MTSALCLTHTHTPACTSLLRASRAPLCLLPLCPPIISSFMLLSLGTVQGVLHTVAGYLLYTSLTFKYVFDHHHDDVYWCTADIGWITGHSYITYGPLANGATSVLVSVKQTFCPLTHVLAKRSLMGAWRCLSFSMMHVCVLFSSLKVFQSILMSAGSGRLLRSIK